MTQQPDNPAANPDLESVLLDAARRAAAYLRGVRDRPIRPAADAVERLSELGGPLPESGLDVPMILQLLDSIGSPATVVNAGGRYFGFVTGGALPAALPAGWMTSCWDQNSALRVMSPVAATLEDISLRWVCEVLALPANSAGAVVTGATMANFTGLAAARHALLSSCGWNVENDGLFGAPDLKVVVGDEVHASLLKALSLLGLGRQRVHRVPVDGQGRMRADRLPELDKRTIVCIQAGNVNTGAFDPAHEICSRVKEAGGWVHVDGAFGLWAAASPRYRHLTEGYGLADSWATDAHKWPNVGYDCGIAIVRDASYLRNAMTISAAYFEPGRLREPSDYTPEMSRRARGIELWAALRSLGRKGLADLIDRTCRHARTFADRLGAAGYEILNDVVINQVLVSFGASAITKEVIQRLQADGTCWCGGTEWQGKTAMRISVSSWATTDQDVADSIEAILRIARQCL